MSDLCGRKAADVVPWEDGTAKARLPAEPIMM